MNQNLKTIAFVGVAVVVSLVVWLTRPRLPALTSESELPKVLFAAFDDPLSAASLEIVEFNESTATIRPFKVAQVDEEWAIPSHASYPADAKDQLAEVAAGFVGLKPLGVAGDTAADQRLFGVVDPDPKKLKPGDTGVGTRVEIRDKKDELLLALIIGKKVPDRGELRYVRIPGKDPVYTVKVKTDKLSTKFEDWIEKDLLKLNTWDVKQVRINDYSVDVLRGVQTPRSLMTLDYDDGDSKWKLNECKVFKEQGWVEVQMAEDEEINTSKLNDMKSALDELKIVDVAQKPEGLSENLRDAGELKKDAESLQSLADRGFYPVKVGERIELVSTEGEVSVSMKDGVQYVLRFGQVAGRGEEAEEKPEEGEEKASDDAGDAGVNRYLFVMAEFNPDAIAEPELEPMPGEEKAPEGEAPKEEASNGGEPEEKEGASKSEKPEGKTPEAPAPEAKAAEGKASEEESAEGEKEAAKAEPAAKPEKKAAEGDGAKTDADKEKSEADKERERIEKENKRKQEEFDEKVKKGKDRVKELNERFADWYYVISDKVYQKIHLSREDVVKKQEKEEKAGEKTDKGEAGEKQDAADASADQAPKEKGNAVSDFEKLKEEGVEGEKE
ncbi:MAG TPA: DUF4340 domain-containing protein [Thermoguttaceae bacterium]|nr:DUF4340 domain-containing protein [Thermoguttaceae bacterium]